MDQLKPYLAALKKYHFWILCVVVLVAAFFGWRSGTQKLNEEFEANSSQIASAFSQAGSVRQHDPHPNQDFVEEKNAAHDKVLAELLSAWQLHYDKQQSVLTWPGPPVLLDGFAAVPRDGEFPDLLRSNYQNEAKKIPALWAPKYNLRRPAPNQPADAKNVRFEGALVWNEVPKLQQRYAFAAPPTSKQIRISQEDFWLYEALLQTVARLNEGRTQHHEAIVKQILTIQLAQQALLAPPVNLPNLAEAKSSDLKDLKETAVDTPDDQLVMYRYCDPAGRPLAKPAGNEEFLLVPVRMQLFMDQRRIPELLVSCANAPLMFDVNLLQFIKPETVVADAGAQRGGQAAGGGGGADKLDAEVGPYDATVEIRGFVYLFNPPDPTRFKPKNVAGQPDVAASN